jgi:two-component system response regulator YesN
MTNQTVRNAAANGAKAAEEIVKAGAANKPGGCTTADQMVRFIDEHYMHELTLDILSGRFNRSTAYISRVIKRKTGKNFTKYLNGLRIGKAKELLRGRGHTVRAVAEMVGFANAVYFRQVFKKATAMTPREYFLSDRW